MNQHNSFPGKDLHETPVAPRYSFANNGLMRQDSLFNGRGLQSIRVITYPKPPIEAQGLSQSLSRKGLVIGQQVEIGSDDDQERFVIPPSARPISYDTSMDEHSDLVYGDEAMFFDLGRLLAHVANEGSEHPLVLNDDVGPNIAIIEFTRPDDPKILLVPGFELSVHPVMDDDTALSIYTTRLDHEFGPRFASNASHFVEGFDATLGLG